MKQLGKPGILASVFYQRLSRTLTADYWDQTVEDCGSYAPKPACCLLTTSNGKPCKWDSAWRATVAYLANEPALWSAWTWTGTDSDWLTRTMKLFCVIQFSPCLLDVYLEHFSECLRSTIFSSLLNQTAFYPGNFGCTHISSCLLAFLCF